MNAWITVLCFALVLVPGLLSAQDEDSYASVYSSPDAASELPPVLHIAKGLPPIKEVGIEAARRIWESRGNPTGAAPVPAKRLTPVRALKKAAPITVAAAPASPKQ